MNRHSDVSPHAGAGERMLNAARRNPEGLLLLAAGCALLLRAGTSAPRQTPSSLPGREDWRQGLVNDPATRESSRDLGIQQSVSDAAGQARQYASDTADSLNETVRSYATSATEYAQETRRHASEAVDDLQRRGSDYAHKLAGEAQTTFRNTVDYVLREQPLAVAAAGLAAGAALASVFPATRFEKGTIGEFGTRVTDAAHDVGDQIASTASHAGARLKESARDPSKFKEAVSDIIDDVSRPFTNQDDKASGTKAGDETAKPGRAKEAQAGASATSKPTSTVGTSSGSPASGAAKTTPFDRR